MNVLAPEQGQSYKIKIVVFFYLVYVVLWLPSPCTASFQALSVNAFRWRIRDERPGDA